MSSSFRTLCPSQSPCDGQLKFLRTRWPLSCPSVVRPPFALCAPSQPPCTGQLQFRRPRWPLCCPPVVPLSHSAPPHRCLATSFLRIDGRNLVPLSSPFRPLRPVHRARWPLSCPPVVPLSHSAPLARCLATNFLEPGGRYLVPLSPAFRTLRPVLKVRWLLSCPLVGPLSNSAPPLSCLATARWWILGPSGRYLVPLSSPFRTLRPLSATLPRPGGGS
jgi:hypothetical protein